MILTASDVSSVSSSLTRWEWAEYIAEAFVVLGCLGELVADVGKKRLGESRSERLERWSTIVLIVALVVSLTALVRTNELSGFVIGSLGDRADRADGKAQTALTDSATASRMAAQAKSTAGAAKTEADDSKATADQVFSVADNARKAASDALSIAADAKTQVATVQSNIAKVDAKYAARTLSTANRDILVNFLTMYLPKPTQPVEMNFDITASDGEAFGKEIASAINSPGTGWQANEPMASTGDGEKVGVFVAIRDAVAPSHRAAGILQHALQAAGIDAIGITDPRLPVGSSKIEILICRKN